MSTVLDASVLTIPRPQYLRLNSIDGQDGVCDYDYEFRLNDLSYVNYVDINKDTLREHLKANYEDMFEFLRTRCPISKEWMDITFNEYTEEFFKQIDASIPQFDIFVKRNKDKLGIYPCNTYNTCIKQRLRFNYLEVTSYYVKVYSYKRNTRKTPEWVAQYRHLDERHLDHFIEEEWITHDRVYNFK